MTSFIGTAALLCVIAGLLLTRSMWWRPGLSRRRSLPREVAVLSEQLRQIDRLHEAGALTAEQHAASKAVVERKLLDALETAPSSPTPAERSSGRLAALLVAFMVAVAAGGYALVGSPRNIESSGTASDMGSRGEAATAPHALDAEQIAAMTDRLVARLSTHPDDADGWSMLARSYVAMGRPSQAIAAFVKAEALRPRDPDLLADHADVLAMSRGRQLAGEPTELVRRALEIDPDNNKALALAGTAAFDRMDYGSAATYWERLAQVEPPDGPFASQVEAGIAEARRLGKLPPSEAPLSMPDSDTQAVAASGTVGVPDRAPAQVAGTITLAAPLKSRASPDDTVFVFARAADGGRMPLAILRKQVRDLPLHFVLDDSLAMSPSANLSSANRVVVGARVSKSGNAMPQDGDLQGVTKAVAVGTTGLRIEIDHEVTQ